MSKETLTPEVRFEGFTDSWKKIGFPKAFEFPVTTNSLSRSQLNYDNGVIKSIHYGDILIQYNAILDVAKDKIPFITNGILRDYQSNVLANGDIVFADAAEDEMVGKAVEVNGKTDEKIVSGLHTIVARPKINMAEYFLGHYINSNKYHDQLLRLMQGTKVLSISKKSLNKTSVSYPVNPKEQHKVGLILKQTDDIINLRQQELTKLQNFKQAMLQKMFPKEGQSVPEIRFDGFDGPWEECKLGDIADVTGGGTPSTTNHSYWNGTIDWYSPVEIGDKNYVDGSQNKITKLGLENSSAKILPVGTVLFTSRAGIGTMAILAKEGATNQGFQSIIPHDDVLDSYFIYARANELKRYGEKKGAGSTFIEVSGKQMKKMPILIPSIEEQRQIGKYFEHMDNMIQAKKAELKKLKQFKQAMLSKLFV